MPILRNLLAQINYQLIKGDVDVKVEGLACNSKEVNQNYIFFALKGEKTHGLLYADEAIANGAKVIFTDENYYTTKDVTIIKVADIVGTMAKVSSVFYGNPSSKLKLVGVTGTNGKTTVVYLIEHIFNANLIPTGLISTVEYRYKNTKIPASLTTPQSLDLQKLFFEMLNSGIEIVAMETSSHALSLGRLENIEFDVACFTNLSHEHLDFHKTMDEYFSAKRKLFQKLRGEKYAIINIDDDHGKKLQESIDAKIITYGIKNNADIKANNITTTLSKTNFTIKTRDEKIDIEIKPIGLHNVYNALAAFTVAKIFDIPTEKIKKALSEFNSPPGRLEKINLLQPFHVFIDYAHTPNALENILTTLKSFPHNRIIVVFGCGGERDRLKRPLMGEIASRLADYVILTNDNPRNEEPEKIILDIEVGIHRIGKNNYTIIQDRKEAIKHSIEMALEDDIILIAGKGHENYQIIKNEKIPFNDRIIAEEFIKRKLWKRQL